MRMIALAAAMLATGCGKTVGGGDGVLDADEVPDVGWIAQVEGRFHDVSFEAEIVDEGTLEIRDFTYDGGGINARMYLLIDGEPFHRDFELTDNLVGEARDGDTLTLDIPSEAGLDRWNLISLWCVPAAVSFGDGVFAPPG
jgi:hypothetical protein